MSAATQRWLLSSATLGAAAMGGVFLAFSTFVMPALARLDTPDGVRAMQHINRVAPTPWFMVPLFGTATAGLVLAARSVRRLDESDARAQTFGAGLYLAAIILTVAYHVPRNDDLALLDPLGPDATSAWREYQNGWNSANHLRALLCLGAAASWTVASVHAAE